jgi:hypothetical protein
MYPKEGPANSSGSDRKGTDRVEHYPVGHHPAKHPAKHAAKHAAKHPAKHTAFNKGAARETAYPEG